MIKLFIIGDAKRLPRPREPSDRLRLKRREKAEGFRMLCYSHLKASWQTTTQTGLHYS